MSAPDCSRLERDDLWNAWLARPAVAKQSQPASSQTLTAADVTALRTELDDMGAIYTRCNNAYGSSNPSTTLSQTITKIQTKRAEIETIQERTEIAKDRVQYLSGAKRPVSYYEGWFTIGRPLQPYMLHVLMGISLFSILLTLYFFSLAAGYSISISAPTGPSNPYLGYLSSFGTPFWVLLVVSIGTITYLVRRVYGQA